MFPLPIVFILSITEGTAVGTTLRRHGITPCGVWLTVPKLHDVLCDERRIVKHSLVRICIILAHTD
jgi:hypothetical protein